MIQDRERIAEQSMSIPRPREIGLMHNAGVGPNQEHGWFCPSVTRQKTEDMGARRMGANVVARLCSYLLLTSDFYRIENKVISSENG